MSGSADALERERVTVPDRFRIERLLGRGGAARVYLAFDFANDRPVALRVSRTPVAMVVSNVERQRMLLDRIDDAGIVKMLDTGRLPTGHAFAVYEYIDGESLQTILEASQLSERDALTIVAGVARSLSIVHSLGAIHRDIKPGNVMVRTNGEARLFGCPVLIDFGVYDWLHDHSRGKSATPMGKVGGTAAYMSPEQLMGRPETVATDIYGLGALLYELVFHVQLSAGDDVWLSAPVAGGDSVFLGPLVTRRLSEEVILPEEAGVSRLVRSTIQRSLRISAGERHQSMSEFERDVRNALNSL